MLWSVSRHQLLSFRVVHTVVSIGILTAFIQYAQRFFRPIQDFSEKYNILQSAMAASERVFKLLDTPAEITSPAVTKTPVGPGRIEFDHVWFAYRDAPVEAARTRASRPRPDMIHQLAMAMWGRVFDPSRPSKARLTISTEPDWILRDVSFTIEPGETVAIVGHTGAGKTTIISLLMRFYDVQKGAVKIDGVDVKDMDLAELRRRYGVVLQDPFLFTGTVEGNIRLGTDGITDEDVEKAAEDVNLADFIRALPQGFKEEVRERGSTLSTGQKQLISFARALAHDPKDPDSGRGHFERGHRNRVAGAGRAQPHGRRPHVCGHRPSAFDHPARRQDYRHAQRPGARSGHAPATARPARHLLQALPVAI